MGVVFVLHHFMITFIIITSLHHYIITSSSPHIITSSFHITTILTSMQKGQRHDGSKQRSAAGIIHCSRTGLRVRNDGSPITQPNSPLEAARAWKRCRFGD